MMSRGKLIIVVAPSGSGKGTLVDHIRDVFSEDIVFPVSCTTRQKRPHERDGDVYHYITRDDFETKIKEGYFLEWAEYSGNLYGTPREDIVRHIEIGDTVLREVEIQGARSIKKLMPADDLVIIYIDAGKWENLRARIEARAPLSESEIELRRVRFEEEVLFRENADYIVFNKDGELDQAKKDIVDIIKNLK